MKGAPRSAQFDDVYFSAEDGLAETRHVFLAGNGLPESWADLQDIVIAETGFGTGLNFLAVWQMFEECAGSNQSLHFVSVEKYPLSVDEIRDALSCWEELSPLAEKLCGVYGGICGEGGTVRLTERVSLSLYIGDVNEVLPGLEITPHFWFLDGFRPSTNPEMWSDIVFENMGRLSAPGTRFATFTSAGFVRRGLKAVGFGVQKIPGYGRKREMAVGVYTGKYMGEAA